MKFKEINNLYKRIYQDIKKGQATLLKQEKRNGSMTTYIELQNLTKYESEMLYHTMSQHTAHSQNVVSSYEKDPSKYCFCYSLEEQEGYDVNKLTDVLLDTVAKLNRESTAEQEQAYQNNLAIVEGLEKYIEETGIKVVFTYTPTGENKMIEKIKESHVSPNAYQDLFNTQIRKLVQTYRLGARIKNTRDTKQDLGEVEVKNLSTYTLDLSEKLSDEWREVIQSYNRNIQRMETLEIDNEQSYRNTYIQKQLMNLLKELSALPLNTAEEKEYMHKITEIYKTTN